MAPHGRPLTTAPVIRWRRYGPGAHTAEVIDHSALAEKPTLHGKRIVLVPLAERHTDAFVAELRDAEVRRLTGSHNEPDPGAIRMWCATRAAQPDRLDLAVEDPESGEFLGELALTRLDPDNESADIRIALRLDMAGQGIGTEAIRLVLDYAFERVGLYRVQLEVFEFNPRAIRAYEKAGFRHEGRMRGALLWDGERHDTFLMGVRRDDPR